MPTTRSTLKNDIAAILTANMSNTTSTAQAIDDLADAIANKVADAVQDAVQTYAVYTTVSTPVLISGAPGAPVTGVITNATTATLVIP